MDALKYISHHSHYHQELFWGQFLKDLIAGVIVAIICSPLVDCSCHLPLVLIPNKGLYTAVVYQAFLFPFGR